MKHKKISSSILAVLLVITILVSYMIPVTNVLAYTEKTGKVTGAGSDKVNVRTGPGTSYGNVKTGSGTKVKLSDGYVITIAGEEYASDGKLWYKIKFKYSDGVDYTGYMHSNYITIENNSYEEDAAFEKYMKKQGFPESYKPYLRTLHQKYPNWVFEADLLKYDWSEAVKEESRLGRNLVSKNAISSWKSTVSGAFDYEKNTWLGFDGTSWVAASEKIIAYYMDPRNFLDEVYVFQFEKLSYDEEIHTKECLLNVIKGTFLENGIIENNMTYAEAIMEAAKKSGVSPYNLAASIILEQGRKGASNSISGTVRGFESIYNYYNWKAYAANGKDAITNGLIYAAGDNEDEMRPWNTRYKSIIGGAVKKGREYINAGQDTQYYIKFDFAGTPYTHQYMTNIQAAASEGSIASSAYSDEIKKNTNLVFKIPVFENMPDTPAACPTGTGNPNNYLKELTIEGINMTPTFYYSATSYSAVVASGVSNINISAAAIDSKAVVSGTGNISLKEGNNTITIGVKAENGSTRKYTLTIIREEGKKPFEISDGVTIISNIYNIGDKYITGLKAGINADNFMKNITVTGATASVTDEQDNNYSGNVGTGKIINISDKAGKKLKSYSIILYGDLNGDGLITIRDLLRMKKQILGDTELKEPYLLAGDVDKKEDGITLKDLLKLKKHILGDSTISQ